MRILFISRKFPPSTGGMETAAFELLSALSDNNDVGLVKWGGSNKFLIAVYPWLFLAAFFKAIFKRPDVIYLQDGLMAPLGWMLKSLLRIPSVITVHGLEITHGNLLYKKLAMPFIGRHDYIVSVSNATKEEILKIFPNASVLTINNGIKDTFFLDENKEARIARLAKACLLDPDELKNSKIIYTNGRLVKRKGVSWFVENVMPELLKKNAGNIIYLVSGSGPDEKNILRTIRDNKLNKNVRVLGRVSDETLKLLYNCADMFVMPNIPVKNDMEGFGLVALEAASCGTAVTASATEGIKDAVIDKKNGFLAAPGNAESYVSRISKELAKPSLLPADIRRFTLKNFSWASAADKYEKLMKSL